MFVYAATCHLRETLLMPLNRCCMPLLLTLLLFLAACAAVTERAVPSAPDAANLAARCESINETLVSTRGIGRLVFTRAGRAQNLRMAWASALPDKLRVVLLGLDGRPLVTAAADGNGIYLRDHITGKFYQDSPTGGRLNTLLGLPLDLESLGRLLAGRLPAFDYDQTALLTGRMPDEAGLVLKKWRNRIGRVYLDESRPALTRIEAYRQTGERRYRADIEATRQVAGYHVPRTLSIRDGETSLVLEIERYWANQPVKPGTFRLEGE